VEKPALSALSYFDNFIDFGSVEHKD